MTIISKKNAECFADILEYGVPVAAGGLSLVKGNWVEAGAFGAAGLVHQIGFSKLKKELARLLPQHDIRPNGEKGSIVSAHTSAVTMGAAFVLLSEGVTPFSITLVGLAGITAASRYYTGHHWVKNIAAGAVTGLVFAGAATVATNSLSS